MQPRLANDKRQQDTHDGEKDADLMEKGIKVSLLERIVEVPLPHVEPDLSYRYSAEHGDEAYCKPYQAPPLGRSAKRT